MAKNMKQIGLDVPLFQSHGFGNIKYVQAGGRGRRRHHLPVRPAARRRRPARRAIRRRACWSPTRRTTRPSTRRTSSTFGGHAYDALLVLTEAIKKAGSADREKVRDAIENLKGFVGTAGVFNFSPTDHNGLDLDAFEMLTVKNGKFVLHTTGRSTETRMPECRFCPGRCSILSPA